MNLLLSEFPGVFGIEHIIFLVVSLILIFAGLILTAKKVKSEKGKMIAVKVTAAVLLVCILWNRISITIYDYQHSNDGLKCLVKLIPLSFCGMSSLVNALCVLCLKKDNKVMHFICYIGFVGGLVSMFYPDYLDSQMFFDPRTLSGLLHHTIMTYLIVLNIITGWFRPDIKKWYIYPIGFCILMTFGLAIHEITGYGAMDINSSLIKSLPILTSWYVIGLAEWLLQFIILICFAKFRDKQSFKKIFESLFNKAH